jgi:ATP:cob(I)alamin adenosyltransferase
MSLYTRLGDKGKTSLVGGVQESKTHQRLEAYGAIDELNSFIGLLRTEIVDTRKNELIQWVQHKLFSVGSCLATDTEQTKLKPECLITAENILRLEEGIDLFDSELPEMRTFILPGGCRSAALAHVCRTVCRRAEREIFRLNEIIPIHDCLLVFVNRLSDLLFVIARHECIICNNGDETKYGL